MSQYGANETWDRGTALLDPLHSSSIHVITDLIDSLWKMKGCPCIVPWYKVFRILTFGCGPGCVQAIHLLKGDETALKCVCTMKLSSIIFLVRRKILLLWILHIDSCLRYLHLHTTHVSGWWDPPSSEEWPSLQREWDERGWCQAGWRRRSVYRWAHCRGIPGSVNWGIWGLV